jgi:hypothetical protein
VSPFDDETLERMKACTKVEFPICLSQALLRMFGEKGKKTLDSLVMNGMFEKTPINSPKDIWSLYEKYMKRAANIIGDSSSKVITFQSLKEMESMLCTKCPLYKNELEKRKLSGKANFTW